jgi:hypothetical protein
MKNQMVTILTRSDFGIGVNKFEGSLIALGTKEFAQYNNAPFVSFVPKRKRKGVRILKTYKPYLVVLDGLHPDLYPESGMVVTKEDDTVKISESKYLCFDERYDSDFDKILDAYLTIYKPNVLMDARSTKGYSPY